MIIKWISRNVGFLIVPLLFLSPVLAQDEPPRVSDIVEFFYRILDLFYAFGGLIFLAIAMFLGFQWMISRGEQEKIQEIRQKFLYWITGFLLFFFSATIVSFIYGALEVTDCTGEQRQPGLTLFYETACPEPAYYIPPPMGGPTGRCVIGSRDESVLPRGFGFYPAFVDGNNTTSLERCCAAHGNPDGCP